VEIERRRLGDLEAAMTGAGRPLAVLPGLMPATGVAGHGIVRGGLGPFLPLAGRRRLVLLNRRPHLPRGTGMAELAAEHAEALRRLDAGPVDLAGISTGGSLAQQLAADHPDVVGRLLLASTACRLGPAGKRLQRRVAARIRGGAPRQALAVLGAGLVPPWRGQLAAGVAGWLAAPRLAPHPHDLPDMATTLEAEDAFDLAACRSPIRAPTLIVAGSDDRFYTRALFEETARLVPGSRIELVEGRGHVTVLRDRRFAAALQFLG
jgi:pimeloyl-ACP methyl ester carboxylesterase